ncbi:MAG: GNAT family N-acetyltransferase [Actinomycetota bacterium]|nr:GNAT family N-acetyltransferase [Actinomycetota bacterium]
MTEQPSAAPQDGDGIFPVLSTSRIRLRPATRADGAEFYHVLLELGLSTLPTLDHWIDGVLGFKDSAAQFAVHRKADDELLGFTALYQLDPNARHVKAGVYARFEQARGLAAEASVLTLNYAFAMWDMRKVYFHTTEASLLHYGGAIAKVARREAILQEYLFFRGQLWDVHVFAIHRQDWEGIGSQLVRRLTRHVSEAS